MREAMIKCIILNGIPIVMEAFVSLAKQEKPEDQDHSFTRKDWKADEDNHQRGLSVLETLYGDDNDRIWASFGSHRDIREYPAFLPALMFEAYASCSLALDRHILWSVPGRSQHSRYHRI